MEWTKEKPDYACIFVGKYNDEYEVFKFCWEIGEAPDEDTIEYYLAWTDMDGEEWDDYDGCHYDEYLVLEKLPTMEEVHKQVIAERLKNLDIQFADLSGNEESARRV